MEEIEEEEDGRRGEVMKKQAGRESEAKGGGKAQEQMKYDR